MSWRYIEKRIGDVEQEVTQRDQFRNEDLNLSETLVREAVQNSLDAGPKAGTAAGSVTVTFTDLKTTGDTQKTFLTGLLKEHLKHAEAAGLDTASVDFGNPGAILIEDFGTCGLTGAVDQWEDSHFCDFWRRHGKSHKSGTARGRHGLGKLVFSCSSKLGAFFGSTVRVGDAGQYVMGQCVLNLRNVDGTTYLPHGFFSDMINDGPQAGLQIPLQDADLVGDFHKHLGLARQNNPGLSIVIPFPVDDLSVEKMISIGIVNYFFPILTGNLVLRFNDTEVNAATLRALAETYAKDGIHDADARFDFIESVSSCMASGSAIEIKDTAWASDGRLTESVFDPAQLDTMRKQFRDGELVALKLPIPISHKTNGRTVSHFSIFVQRPAELTKGDDFYVRNGLTVPKERRFGDRKSLGALIANETEVAGFLGDAENAAHSSWSGVAEKLKNNYKNCENTLRAIRHSLVQFHDLLAQVLEEEDEEALLDVLWVDAGKAGKATKKKKDKEPPTPPEPPPEPTPRPIRIEKSTGGFVVRPTPSTAAALPITFSVRAAYDRLRGDPFGKHSDLDFDFKRAGDVVINPHNVELEETTTNGVLVKITDPDFRLEISGFDPNRDLVVKAEVVR